MRKNPLKLIFAFVFCGSVVLCLSFLAWVNTTLAVACFLCALAASTVAYCRIHRKRPRFKAQKDSICQRCDTRFVDSAAQDISQTDALVNQPVISHKSEDENDTVAQDRPVTSFAADNDGYHKMTDIFVNELPNHLKEMQEVLDEGNLQYLTVKVHELKRLDGFTSSDVYCEKALALEQAVMENHVDKVREQLDELIRLCLATKPAHR
ncbi:MAG TPA: hypothetical protein HPP87_10635 [Planctomycetes bacterium]|nr:hypothetical protein [Planctomycetota bacterium]